MNSAKEFATHLTNVTEKLDTRVKALIANPSPTNVHNVRTAIRRVEATFKLLPKEVRREKAALLYLARAKSLFKTTSKIRDIDIVLRYLEKFRAIVGVAEFLRENQEKRQGLLVTVIRSARSLENTSALRMKASQISDTRFEKRRKKLTRRFEDSLRKQVPTMLTNPKLEQLHEFRKSCKMLRYTLEIAPSKREEKLLSTLEKLQTIMGSMVDNHTTLQHLKQTSIGETGTQLVDKINASNNRAYGKFVSLLKKEFGEEVSEPT